MQHINFRAFVFTGLIALAAVFFIDPSNKTHKIIKRHSPPTPTKVIIPTPPVRPRQPARPQISTPVPSYLGYSGIIKQAKEWEREAPDLIDIGVYGKSSNGSDLVYLRLTNELKKNSKPKVMITACIHGNEPWSTGTLMAFFGTMLSKYKEDNTVTQIIDDREIYFIPVVSPDSYPNSRAVDGVDPNRNFPNPSNQKQSILPIKAIQDFHSKIKPNAVLSGHTFGQVFLIPWGESMSFCADNVQYQRIMGKVSQLCSYNLKRACQVYGRPINGGEIDWYYRHGSFSVVMEIGTHQHKPSDKDIQSELERVYSGLIYFVQEAPLVARPTNFSFGASVSHYIFYHRYPSSRINTRRPVRNFSGHTIPLGSNNSHSEQLLLSEAEGGIKRL